MEHVNIPEDGLHEPKGVSLAASNRVYKSDGAGSGAWEQVDAATLKGGINNSTDTGRVVVTGSAGSFESEESLSSDLILYDTETLTAVIAALEARIEALENP